jgi:hypothetical protein
MIYKKILFTALENSNNEYFSIAVHITYKKLLLVAHKSRVAEMKTEVVLHLLQYFEIISFFYHVSKLFYYISSILFLILPFTVHNKLRYMKH